ncbi:ferritin-like domain-containing protein [Flavihumibacter sp. R14]|nr:ferritin-like domain-containing protein [Flavihumibacter soli]
MRGLNKGKELKVLTRNGEPVSSKVPRRTFLQYAALGGAGLAWIASGCKKEPLQEGVYLGAGDIGILNYLYMLEQLEAAFYTQVTQAFYTGATTTETALLNDIRDHEIAHREFFKNALGQVAIPSLDINLSAIDFTSRTSVLETARVFEDLGVSAYNGVGALIKGEAYLVFAGKIVSVEARHAALIRDLISDGSFAGSEVVDENGLDKALSPDEVLVVTSAYITTIINSEDLPTV